MSYENPFLEHILGLKEGEDSGAIADGVGQHLHNCVFAGDYAVSKGVFLSRAGEEAV